MGMALTRTRAMFIMKILLCLLGQTSSSNTFHISFLFCLSFWIWSPEFCCIWRQKLRFKSWWDRLSSSLKHSFIRIPFQYAQEQKNKAKFANGTEEIQLKAEDGNTIPLYTIVAYLFNPYSILSCVGQTTTVWSNLLLAIFFYSMTRKWSLPTIVALALETQRNFYPFVLIVPAVLVLTKDSKSKILSGTIIVVFYCLAVTGLNFAAFSITNNWKFIDSTLGFMWVWALRG